MVGGLMQGLSFEKVLEYSFLMSIPALGAAGLLELVGLMNQLPTNEVLLGTFVATIVSFCSALLVIKALLSLVKRIGFTPFVVYRLFFGVVAFFLR
jgi:undecaprenyl-diphosphatase